MSEYEAYRRSDSALHGTVDTLLDAASTRWVLLSPAESSGVSRPGSAPAPPRWGHDFRFGLWTVSV